MMEDYYKILNLPESASENDIKHAFRALAKKYHPDSRESKENQYDAEEKFLQIKEAYETLSDSEKRSSYDRTKTAEVNNRLLKSKKEYHEGTRAYKKGLYEKAAYHFRNAVEIDNKNALYCSWLGLSLLEQKGSIHEAKKWCEQAVKLNPSNADYCINLALVYKEADAKALFLKYIRQALSIDPHNKRARLWIAKAEGKDEKPVLEKIKTIFHR